MSVAPEILFDSSSRVKSPTRNYSHYLFESVTQLLCFDFHGDIGNKAGASERIGKPVNCLSKNPETYIKLESPDSNLGPGVIQDVPL